MPTVITGEPLLIVALSFSILYNTVFIYVSHHQTILGISIYHGFFSEIQFMELLPLMRILAEECFFK